MKLKSKIMLCMLLAVGGLFAPPSEIYAQSSDTAVIKTAPAAGTTDSGTVKVPVSTITAPSNLTFFGVKVPAWVGTFIIALMTILPGIQYVLKLIPGATTIGGWFGTILNILTFFQKNINAPPASTTST